MTGAECVAEDLGGEVFGTGNVASEPALNEGKDLGSVPVIKFPEGVRILSGEEHEFLVGEVRVLVEPLHAGPFP